MRVYLTVEKVAKIKQECLSLTRSKAPTIREVARIYWFNYPYGPLYYRHLEWDKIKTLKSNQGNYDNKMLLSAEVTKELEWWITSIKGAYNLVCHGQPDMVLTSDASKTGWGCACNGVSAGGHWTVAEAEEHISYLETHAAWMAIKSF